MPTNGRHKTPSKLKSLLISSAKFGLVAGIILWLFKSDRLDLTRVIEFFQNPMIVAWAVFTFLFAGILLGGLRWFILLKAAGIHARITKVASIHWIGLFFNVVMPGAVGGDLIKAVYIMRDAPGVSKTRVMMTVLLDRIFGMAGLFLIGAVVIGIDFEAAMNIVELRPIISLLGLLLLAVVVLFALVFVSPPKFISQNSSLQSLTKTRALAPLLKIYHTLRDYRHSPGALFGAVGISMVVQLACMSYCWQITKSLVETNTDFTRFAAIFPVGILVTAVPIAPGGIGVGHIAFDKLFHIVNLSRGADMFNIYLLGNLCLSLTGLVPYFFFKREKIGQLVEQAIEESSAGV